MNPTTETSQLETADNITFRANRSLYYFYILLSVFLMLFLIGFIMLPAVILWYHFSYITIGANGVNLRKGWLNITNKQVPFDKINTVEVQRSIFDRMFGSGQIRLYTGNDVQGIIFYGIEQPETVKQLIEERSRKIAPHTIDQSAPSAASAADELAKFADLKAKGVISEEEFETKKRQLLG